VSLDSAAIHLDQVFADHKTQADSLVVHLSGALELAEQLYNVFGLYASAIVDDMYAENLYCLGVGSDDSDGASRRELKRVVY